MSDKCSFCGKTWGTPVSKHSMSKCGTRYINGMPARSSGCYEAELARKDELLRKTVLTINQAIINLPDHKDQWPCHCRSCAVAALLQAFLTNPEAVKVMEEK